MKPINYDEIFEKAEARRAALEAITPKLQAIYDLWDTLYAAARPINSVNADFEQLDLEAAALLAQSVGVSVSTLGCGLHYLANVMQMLDRPSKDLLEALKPNEEARHLTPLSEQAAPKAAPEVGNSGFDYKTAADFLNGKTVSDEAVRKFVAMSRWAHNERAALSATLLAMHGVLTSREAEIALLKKALLEAEAAPQQEPAFWTRQRFGEEREFCEAPFTTDWTPLYTAPQPAPAPLSDDTKRLDWMDKDAGERVFHVGADWYTRPTYGQPYRKHKNLRAAIDAALAAQGGKDA